MYTFYLFLIFALQKVALAGPFYPDEADVSVESREEDNILTTTESPGSSGKDL